MQSAGKMIMTIIISALVFFIVLFLLRALLPLAVIIIQEFLDDVILENLFGVYFVLERGKDVVAIQCKG